MKIFKSAVALSVLLTMLVACGDESSSSVSPEPGDDSSSSVIPASSGDLQSSSSQKSSGKDKSSSSEKSSEESSSSAATKNSSSSVDDDKSSSSIKKEDSSSSVVIASSSSSIKVDDSSASVKPESSSTVTSSAAVASSSSVAEQSSSSSYDRTDAFKGTLWRAGAYKTFVDSRDNREYYYIEIAGEDTAGKAATIKVMVENLNVGELIRGRKNQEDDSKIERYCYDNDTTNCNKYGGLYQWAEMMQLPSRCNTESCADLIKPNHQGICPSGWRLLTYNDYYIVVHADNNKYGVEGTRSAYGFGGSNDTGYSLIGTGYRSDEGGFARQGDYTFWFYPEEQSSQVHRSSCNGMSPNKSTVSPGYQSKVSGASVRCVMVE
ncbi:FISUMP domain-containing protein [Fibrobacter sp.]|uniref:FISUMP domain-containing protein n=1 Tax=Fibrobacter sp. TaxID=35828 RepID=UPI0026082BE5|nr:FISUMP domain-containing protein [Fibrobacter sp.]MDD5943411.1 FISUMP domain-containing protein [Fibrobacter sp.]